jgi:hypothetical protein
MKKYLLVVFSSALLTASFAQSWSLTGNSGTTPSTNFLGTRDNQALVFKTNNGERVRISSTGNVGIGTTNPVQKLHVNGNLNLSAGFALYMENKRVLRVDSTNANIFLGNRTGVANTTGFANTATGYLTLSSNTNGSYNTGYGAETLKDNASGYNNTAIGSYAMRNNTSGTNNIATGVNALYYNTTGSYNVAFGNNALIRNTSGTANSAYGFGALYYNIDGSDNVADGYFTLYNNTAGKYNTATGKEAMYANTIGSFNTATGFKALYNNNTGDNNTANGSYALYSNSSGYENTATGLRALFFNVAGSNNTALGSYALYNTTNSSGNTAVGYHAGDSYDNGYYNTFIGSDADATANGIYNSIALGSSATVTAANQVRIGNSYTTSIGGNTNWSTVSDGRVKRNVKENVPGLAFINKLKPVTYNLDLDAADKIMHLPTAKDKEGKQLTQQASQIALNARIAKQQIVYTGFVAQDVEKAAKELNYDFSGVDAAKGDKDLYALRYSDFVVPLVKAVQDLSKMNDEKDEAINSLKSEIRSLRSEIDELKSTFLASTSTTNYKLQTANLTSASLDQNIPNPFRTATKINYELPQHFSSAKIIITDKSGKTLKEIDVSGSGKGSLHVDALTLSSGTYQYSFYVDGRLIETKQMVLLK